MEDLVDQTSPLPSYTVVARRYRPKSFSGLIGQEHVAQALTKAIETGRVGHAYLFTGARGVGKTSAARIFAKALSITENAPPELARELTEAIDGGEDLDVIEIDGASHRGIDEIRQLRANVTIRPSRARYKIYIIDEVHMLTVPAFNALLKTLEEPPAHVKFIFCTTEPDKVPITIRSRCQRFDFAPIRFESILQRLREISQAEGYDVEEDALALLARRAAGSMRDSQSLLEQVMSFSTGRITVGQINTLLGTADEGSLQAVVRALVDRDALAAITAVGQALTAGADAGQVAEQLLNYLRDIMTAGIGGGPQLLKLANPVGHEHLKQLANQWGLQTILAAIQILDEALGRMRTSVSALTLLEVALVQISQLENLLSIPALLETLAEGASGRVEQKKKPVVDDRRPGGQAILATAAPKPPPAAVPTATEAASALPGSSAPPPVEPLAGQSPIPASAVTDSLPAVSSAAAVTPLPPAIESADGLQATEASPIAVADHLTQWKRATASIEGLLADYAALVAAVEPQGSDSWRVVFPPGAAQPRSYCEQPARKSRLEAALANLVGRSIRLAFDVQPGQAPATAPPASNASERGKRLRQLSTHPLIKKVCEVLDGEIVRVNPAQPPQSPHATAREAAATNQPAETR